MHGNQYPVQFIDIELKKCQDRQDPTRDIKRNDKNDRQALANKYPCHDFEPKDRADPPRFPSACQVAKTPGEIKKFGEPGYRKQHEYCEYDDAIVDGLVGYVRSRKGQATRISGDLDPINQETMGRIWSEMEKLQDRMWVRTYKLERVQ